MAWSTEEITKYEDIISKLSAEAHHAKPGCDEGLIPIYSLLNEISDTFQGDAILEQAVTSVLQMLQAMLDEAKPFDDDSINHMISFAKWSESLISAANSDQDFPTFDPNTATASTPIVKETTPEADPLELTPVAETPTLEQELTPNFNLTEENNTFSNFLELTRFDSIAQQFSAELLLAEKGTDNGMLPIYSLLKDLQGEFEGDEHVRQATETVLVTMDDLLDTASVFDSASILLLTEFNLWLETARAEVNVGGNPIPFEPTQAPEAPESAPVQAVDQNNEDACLLKEFSEFDIVMDLNLEENRELLEEFYSEAVDHLGQIETAVLELEQDVTSQDAIDSMFRSFHTIKGVAGFLNLIPMNRLAHEVESLMDLVRNHKLAVFTGIIDLVLEAKDAIGQLIEQISDGLSQGQVPDQAIVVSVLMARARWAMEGPESYAERTGSNNTMSQAPAQEEEKEVSSNQPISTSAAKEAIAQTKPQAQASPKRHAGENASVRVNTWKLDNLMDMVGELVIVQSQLHESAKIHDASSNGQSNFQSNMSQISRITKDLQHTSMSLRMIPIKSTFQKMERIVRDLSAKSGKKVLFEVVGEDTELDRNVVEEIGDPLVHMVRNALDHGVEAPEDRLEHGKSETGHLLLKAYHRGSNIVVELQDDGRGIDADKVLAKAIANGIVREDENLPKEEIYKLIFAPGFSTAEQITDISGRGVGMDVVKKNIEKLRGKIEIESELGKGSTFKILLPLTMAIVDGLVVKVGEDRFILPTTSVKVALRPKGDDVASIQGNEEVLNIRGKIIPLFRLHNHFNIDNAVTDIRKATVVVVETTGKPYGLLVDDMVSKQEVVIKSLGSMMQGIPGVSGGAILGDGSIALILDPVSLIGS